VAEASNTSALLRLALPLVVSRAGLVALGLADAIMVAHHSATEFAALALADGTVGRLVDVFVAFVIGGLVLVPRAFAAGDAARCRRLWVHASVLACGLGAVALVACLLAGPLFRVTGQAAALAGAASPVAAVLGLGHPGLLLAIVAAIYLEGIGRPVLVALAVVGANALNIGLNALLIGGQGGAPALGALGSAVATSCVSWLLALLLVGRAWWLGRPNSLGTAAAPSVTARAVAGEDDDAVTAEQRRLGYAAATVQAVLVLTVTVLTVFAGRLGALPLAAMTAVFTLNAPAMLFALGLGDAAAIRIAGAAGQGRPAAPLARHALALTAAAMLLFALAWLAFPAVWAGLFGDDAELSAAVRALLPLAAAVLCFDGISVLVVATLRAQRDVFWPAAAEVGAALVLLPLAAALAFGAALGVTGLLAAAAAAGLLRTGLLLARLRWFHRDAAGAA